LLNSKPLGLIAPAALPHDEELDKKAAFEATPILVDGKLFLEHSIRSRDRIESRDGREALGI